MKLNLEKNQLNLNPQESVDKNNMLLIFKDGKNMFIGTMTQFILWNTSNGKTIKSMKEEIPVKSI